jgi:hypothetical protein
MGPLSVSFKDGKPKGYRQLGILSRLQNRLPLTLFVRGSFPADGHVRPKEHSFAQNCQFCAPAGRGISLALSLLPIKRFAMASPAFPKNRTPRVS